MNRLINNAVLIAVAAVGIHANAMSTLSRDFEASQSCRTHVVRDDEGARLRYSNEGWIAKGDRPGQTRVFLNARAREDGAFVPRRVQCVVTTFSQRVLTADVQPGRFIHKSTG